MKRKQNRNMIEMCIFKKSNTMCAYCVGMCRVVYNIN